MIIQKLKLQNFRCFQNQSFDFESSFVVIEGDNGSGKSSFLEAIYFACYLRSFRQYSTKDIIQFDTDHFFISVDFEEKNLNKQNQIRIGFSKKENKKVVKLNKQAVSSYRGLIDHFRVISSSEEDILLVKSYPEFRRSFLNHLLFLDSEDAAKKLRSNKVVLDNRNQFLKQNSHLILDKKKLDEIKVWSQQLWQSSLEIEEGRKKYLQILEVKINKLLEKYFNSMFVVKFEYLAKNREGDSFEDFWQNHTQRKLSDELKSRRSMFGAHLDDFQINLSNKKARFFASRGQQKLIVFLLKVAQLQILKKQNKPLCFLLDDFLTDFDKNILDLCLKVLEDLDTQIFLTSPLKSFFTDNKSINKPFQLIRL